MIPGYTTTIDSESCYELQDFFHNTWADFYQLSSLFYNMNPGGAGLPDFFVYLLLCVCHVHFPAVSAQADPASYIRSPM